MSAWSYAFMGEDTESDPVETHRSHVLDNIVLAEAKQNINNHCKV